MRPYVSCHFIKTITYFSAYNLAYKRNAPQRKQSYNLQAQISNNNKLFETVP